MNMDWDCRFNESHKWTPYLKCIFYKSTEVNMRKFINLSIYTFTTLLFLLTNDAFAQVRNNYVEAQREIQKEINTIPKYSPDDFSSIKDKIAISRKVNDDDLTNQNVPDEIEKKELLKYARAFRDRSNEIANVQKKYFNDSKYRYVKDILRKEYDLTIENANNVYKLLTDGVKNSSTFGEINKNDRLNDVAISEKRTEINASRDSYFAGFVTVENNYLEFNNCISKIAKKDDENYRGYPEIIYLKIKNDDSCKQYKSTDVSAKTINEFLGEGKPLSIRSKEAENYQYDVELSCSFGSILGGIIIQRQGQVQIPDCVQGLGQFVHNYSNIANYYKKQNDAEVAKQQAIKNAENQQIIQKKRILASKDPVARALNYAAGGAEDASGPNFFYPIDNSPGKCSYGMQSDSSAMGQLSQSMMGAFAAMAPILGSAGVQMPSTATNFDLTKVDFSSIAYYKVNGSTPRTKYSQSTPYLKYQTKVDGLPDYFECDSNSCSMERLQRAWKLVAQTCKGTKKAF
jgi:hypothetical protein